MKFRVAQDCRLGNRTLKGGEVVYLAKRSPAVKALVEAGALSAGSEVAPKPPKPIVLGTVDDGSDSKEY